MEEDRWKPLGEMEGPDQIIQTDNVFTTESNGYCRIRSFDVSKEDIAPISLVTAIKNTCEANDACELIAMKIKREDKWVQWRYSDYFNDIKCVTRAFIDLGLEPRHSVAICGFNSPEWFISEMACIYAGGMVRVIFSLTVIFCTNSA